MVIAIKDGENTITGGVWLIAPEDIPGLPIGIRYAILSDNPDLFGGKDAIIVDGTYDLYPYNAENSDNKYPNGQPIYEVVNLITWITVEEPGDPLASATDAQVYLSAVIRQIIPSNAPLYAGRLQSEIK